MRVLSQLFDRLLSVFTFVAENFSEYKIDFHFIDSLVALDLTYLQMFSRQSFPANSVCSSSGALKSATVFGLMVTTSGNSWKSRSDDFSSHCSSIAAHSA